MESPEDIRSALSFQTCTEQYWKVFPNDDAPKITDGVKVMIEMCGAFWLAVAIVSWQGNKKVRKEPFQVWTLILTADEFPNGAVLVCEDGNHRELARQEIEYTDFPLPEGIKLFLCDGILLLPSEY